jgi:hypothetical protein
MCESKPRIAAALMAAIMLLSPVPILSGCSDAESPAEEYGAEFGIDYGSVDGFVRTVTGALMGKEIGIDGLIESFLSRYPGYELSLIPGMDSDFAIKRTIGESGSERRIADRIAGYVELSADFAGRGNFPGEGTYLPAEGETVSDLVERAMLSGDGTERDLRLGISFRLYFDADILTLIDLGSGEISGASVKLRMMSVEKDRSNFGLDIVQKEDGSPESLSVRYGTAAYTSNMFVSLGADLSFTGLRILGGSGSWDLQAGMTAHVDEFLVSSDFADSALSKALDMAGFDLGGKLPRLIMNIITSSDRMLDLFDTIDSLTGTEIPDVHLRADLTASDAADDSGRRYTSLRKTGDESGMEIRIPHSSYAVDFDRLLRLVPNYILPEEKADKILLVLAILGWDTREILDLRDDPETSESIGNVFDKVDREIEDDKKYELSIPAEYICIAAAGLAALLAGAAFIWRRGI